MRLISGVLASSLLIVAVATARAQEGGIINPTAAIQNVDQQSFRALFERMNPVTSRASSPFTIEGLPKGARGERLTWERAYALAIVRSRDGGKALAPTLDPKALDDQAVRLAVVDFGRFREEFLAGGRRFRDPSARFFDLLARARATEHARSRLAALEGLSPLVRELVQGESSGLSQFHVDQVDRSTQAARLDFLDRQMRYRDALDELKVELGLAPRAAVELDQSPLAKFSTTFDDVIRWSADSSRSYQGLRELVQGLPGLGDLSVSGRSLLEAAEDQTSAIEEFITASGALATNRGTSAELDVRRRARKLVELAIAYPNEQRHLLLILRVRSMAQEQLLAPPRPGLQAQPSVVELIDAQDQFRESEDRLVEIWTSYHALRLALARDLNLLPVDHWKAFYDQMLGGKDDPARPRPIRPPAPTPPGRPAPLPPPAPLAPPGQPR